MDLTTMLQEHRTFIISVIAGLLVFFVGQSVISGVFSVDEKRGKVFSTERSLKKCKTPTTDQLDEARTLNDLLSEHYDSVMDRVCFIPDPKYLLSKREKPDIQYDRLFSEARDALVEGAKILNITVDGSLGMPELSPTRVSEIQRALLALDVVTRVVLMAIESQVGLIDSITMEPEKRIRKSSFIKEQQVNFKMQGSASAIAGFFERFGRQENFLAISDAKMEMMEKDGASIKVEFTVSALTLIKEESET